VSFELNLHDLPKRDTPPRMRSYEEARGSHKIELSARYNPVIHIVDEWAAAEPDALALVSVDGGGNVVDSHSATELARESRRAARALLSLGVRKGDFVYVMLPRVSAWYWAMLGAMRIGAVPMPAPNMLVGKDIAYRIGRAQASTAITDAAGAAKLDALSTELTSLQRRVCWSSGKVPRDGWIDFTGAMEAAGDGPTPNDPTAKDDPLVVFFTSGTVSYPKMVLHTQSYALGHVGTARYWHDLRPGDRHWTIADTGWAKAAWGGLFGQWHERATVVQVALGKADADTVLAILERQRITSFCAPPTLYRQLVLANLSAYDLTSLRHCTSAGEPLNPEVIRAWSNGTGGLTIFDGFGQSESTVLVANFRAVEVRPGSMGKPVPGYDVDVRSDDGGRTADGELGAIAVRTEPHPVGLFSGYFGEPDATAERFRHGWYFTGDRGRRDSDGYIWFEGREDDVITSSAYRIGPFEVESALIEHPDVIEAGVVGRKDPQRTEIVCAFVILVPGCRPTAELTASLQAHARTVTAPYKYPREIIYVNELPKTISGKIRRAVLRDWLRDGVPQGVEVPLSVSS
jgi:acetyl-CoA synthetase